jgi:hypothetical protein
MAGSCPVSLARLLAPSRTRDKTRAHMRALFTDQNGLPCPWHKRITPLCPAACPRLLLSTPLSTPGFRTVATRFLPFTARYIAKSSRACPVG